MKYQFNIETDHFQILIGDRVKGPRVDTAALWSGGQSVAALSSVPELIGLSIARFGGRTRVGVDVVESQPETQLGWKEQGEFSLYVPSGSIRLWGPETIDFEQVVSIPLKPGTYSGRAFSRGTDEVLDEMANEDPMSIVSFYG